VEGNLLLGVGPTSEGIIQPEVEVILKEIGDWLKINGKSIYNTRITPHYHSGDVWFTADKDSKTIYAHYVPENDKKIPSVIEWEGNTPKKGSKVTLLHIQKQVKWTVDGNKTRIVLPVIKNHINLPLVFSFETSR